MTTQEIEDLKAENADLKRAVSSMLSYLIDNLNKDAHRIRTAFLDPYNITITNFSAYLHSINLIKWQKPPLKIEVGKFYVTANNHFILIFWNDLDFSVSHKANITYRFLGRDLGNAEKLYWYSEGGECTHGHLSIWREATPQEIEELKNGNN